MVRAQKKPGTYEDSGGLRLLITATGCKRWVMRISRNGKRHEFGLGSYPAVSLERAREDAAAIRTAASAGRNVKAERSRQRGATTFRHAFETFFAIKGPQLSNAKHREQWRSTMESYVFPKISERSVADVTAADVLNILKPIWFKKPETAKRVLQRLEAVFKSAILREHRTRASPCIGVAQELGTRHRQVTSHRSLPHQEVAEFLARLRAGGGDRMARMALEWIVLTAARSGEARLARWSEINEGQALWTIPAERMKARRPHVVPLSRFCLDLLHELGSRQHSSGLLFPGQVSGKPLSDMALTMTLRSMGYACRATVHGFRSTFKVWSAEVAKAGDEVSEAALAHVIPEKVRAAYLRTDFLEARRDLMASWATYCVHLTGSTSQAVEAGHPEGVVQIGHAEIVMARI
jgi:integrase